MKTKLLIVVIFNLVLYQSGCSGGNDNLRNALSLNYEKVDSLRNVSPLVVNEILHLTQNEEIAEIGEHFQATDVISGNSPRRRFVIAALDKRSQKYWLICYEHGGIGLHYHIALFKVDGGNIEKIIAGQALPKTNKSGIIRVQNLIDALANGKVEYDNHW